MFEVLVEKIDVTKNLISLMTRFIPGEQTYKPFEALFKVTEADHKDWINSHVMINFFKSFDTGQDNKADPVADPTVVPNLKYEQLMRGYFDDPLNTDQAWKELELWHFNYNKQEDVLNQQIGPNLEWKEVTETLFSWLTLSQSQVIQLIVDKLNIDIR